MNGINCEVPPHVMFSVLLLSLLSTPNIALSALLPDTLNLFFPHSDKPSHITLKNVKILTEW
jgi:P pilus assembly chaperone PapD